MPRRPTISYLKLLETSLTACFGWNFTAALRASVQSTVETKADRLGLDPMIYAHRAATTESELYTLADEVCSRTTRPTINQSQFLFLGAVLISQIAETSPTGGPIRTWCSSAPLGLEPFLPLIAISELNLPPKGRHRVLLTEWRATILQAVSLGRFASNEVAALPRSLQEKYLAPVGQESNPLYQLSDQIRVKVQVERANLLRTAEARPHRGAFDLVLSPGSLTFLTDAARQKWIRQAGASLRPGGILVLSESETSLFDDLMFAKIESGPKGFYEFVGAT